MPIELHWPEIALRLALTVAAGGLLGAERSKTGHAAGLRTTLLVSLAASVAMIQMNLLLPTNGKPTLPAKIENRLTTFIAMMVDDR